MDVVAKAIHDMNRRHSGVMLADVQGEAVKANQQFYRGISGRFDHKMGSWEMGPDGSSWSACSVNGIPLTCDQSGIKEIYPSMPLPNTENVNRAEVFLNRAFLEQKYGAFYTGTKYYKRSKAANEK